MSLQGILRYSGKAALFAVAVTLLWGLIQCFISSRKQQGKSSRDLLLQGVLVFYLSALIEITVLRFGENPQFGFAAHSPETIQLVPLVYTFAVLKNSLWMFLYAVVGNILWFVPLGFLLPAVMQKGRNFKITLLVSAATSLLIEVFQWILATGLSDVDDIIFNAMGGALGWLLWHWCFGQHKSNDRR